MILRLQIEPWKVTSHKKNSLAKVIPMQFRSVGWSKRWDLWFRCYEASSKSAPLCSADGQHQVWCKVCLFQDHPAVAWESLWKDNFKLLDFAGFLLNFDIQTLDGLGYPSQVYLISYSLEHFRLKVWKNLNEFRLHNRRFDSIFVCLAIVDVTIPNRIDSKFREVIWPIVQMRTQSVVSEGMLISCKTPCFVQTPWVKRCKLCPGGHQPSYFSFPLYTEAVNLDAL